MPATKYELTIFEHHERFARFFQGLENFTLNFSNHWNFRVFAFPMLGNFGGGHAGGGAGGGGECGQLRGAAGEVRAVRDSGEQCGAGVSR